VEQTPTSDSVLVSSVRVEYNGMFLGESPKIDVLPDGTAEYDFSTSFECSRSGPHTVDVVVHKPLLLTVLEVGQKDKKKPEKLIPIGQAVVDLLPLVQGTKLNSTAFMTAPCSLFDLCLWTPEYNLSAFDKATVEVTVSAKDILLSATEFWTGSLLSITLEAAYSVPEGFTTEAQQSYMACLQIPTADNDLVVLFKDGILKADGEKEPCPRPKKWPLGGIVAPAAQAIPSSFIVGGPYEEEDGELTKMEVRKALFLPLLNTSCIFFVPSLRRRITQCRFWPVELCRLTVISAGKGKASKVEKGDDDKQVPFHGVAYVDMGPLLCPGVKQIRGAFRVYTYQDNEVFAKTKTQHSIFRDRRSEISLIKEGMASSPVSKAAPSKAQKEEKEICGCVLCISLCQPWLQTARHREQCLSPQQYNEAGTFLIIEIMLDKPLVPKRQREELAQRVKEIIPPHATLPGRTDGAEKAVEDYHKRVTSVALSILSEYHDLFGKDLPDKGAIDHKILEEQKRQLNYELNTSGKYFAFKEQLKYSVVKIVREKYLKTTAFETKEELQTFLCELYVYLMDHMHIALNKLLSEEDVSSAPPSLTTSNQLGLFAREAEADKNFDLACLFHKQVREPLFFPSWLDYGAFCLLHETTTKAQECFQQALRLDPEHVQSLLLCGIMAVMLQHWEEAEIFFEDACCLDPSNIIAWTLSGLFYELQNNYIRAERNFREAKKLLRTQLEEERRILEAAEAEEGKKPSFPYTDPEERLPGNWANPGGALAPARRGLELCGDLRSCSGSRNKSPILGLTETHFLAALCIASGPQRAPCTIFMKTLDFLMKVNAVRFVHMALAHEMLSLQGGPTCAYYLALAWTYSVQNDLVRCEECLHEAIRVDPLNPNVWAQKGHLCYLRKDFKKAKDYYERVISFMEDASDMHFVYLRLGSIYLEEKQYSRAKHIYLLACNDSPSCLTWLGVGIACYRMGQMVEAEDALSEANTLNNTHAEVWAYLALVSLNGGRQLEAEQCYKYTLKVRVRAPLEAAGTAHRAPFRAGCRGCATGRSPSLGVAAEPPKSP
uniref:Cilia and flagella associated protein 70 n=1 Tax=Malurus cyaneus samueli TaxID=2593467 RepID=A0A8C5U9K3_9PASS